MTQFYTRRHVGRLVLFRRRVANGVLILGRVVATHEASVEIENPWTGGDRQRVGNGSVFAMLPQDAEPDAAQAQVDRLERERDETIRKAQAAFWRNVEKATG